MTESDVFIFLMRHIKITEIIGKSPYQLSEAWSYFGPAIAVQLGLLTTIVKHYVAQHMDGVIPRQRLEIQKICERRARHNYWILR